VALKELTSTSFRASIPRKMAVFSFSKKIGFERMSSTSLRAIATTQKGTTIS